MLERLDIMQENQQPSLIPYINFFIKKVQRLSRKRVRPSGWKRTLSYKDNDIVRSNGQPLAVERRGISSDYIRTIKVRSSGKMSEQRVPYSVREEAMTGLKDWFAARIDESFFNQIAGNTNVSDTRYTAANATVAPDSDHWKLATASDAEVSLSASSVFTLTLIDTVVTKMKMLTPPIRPLRIKGEEKYVCFIHPYQSHQLRTNTNTAQYMDIQKAALTGGQISKNPIYTGALCEYNGVIMHESTRVPTPGVSNVYRAILCGAQAAVLCTGRQTKAGLDATWAEELFDWTYDPLSSDAYSKGCENGGYLWN